MYKLQWARRDPLYQSFFESGSNIKIGDEAYPKHAYIEGIVYPSVMLMTALSLYSDEADDLTMGKVAIKEEKHVRDESFLIFTEGFLHSTLKGLGFCETLIERMMDEASKAGATRAYVFASEPEDRQVFQDLGFKSLRTGTELRTPLMAITL